MNIIKGKQKGAARVVIYGPEKIGKTTLASQFPDPIIIDVEGGSRNLDVARTERPHSWRMIRQQLCELRTDPQGFKTLVIDSIDWAEELLTADIIAAAASENITSIESFGYGKGFTVLGERFGKFLNYLIEMNNEGWNIVLIAHTEIKKFDQPDEAGSYDRYQLKLTKKCGPLLKEWADAILFCNYQTFVVEMEGKKKGQGKKRVMHTTYSPAWDAGTRWGLPDTVDMDYSVLAPFASTSGAQQGSPQPAQPAQPAQRVAPADSHPDLEAKPENYEKDEREAIDNPEVTSPQKTGTRIPETNPGGFPVQLMELMQANGVSEEQIRKVVAAKGYYPENTPIHNYEDKFIDGVLVAAWPKVLEYISQLTD